MADPIEQEQITERHTVRSVLSEDLRDALARRCVALPIVVLVTAAADDYDDYRVEVSAHDCNDGLFTHHRLLSNSEFLSYDRRQAWIEAATAAIVVRWCQPMDDALALAAGRPDIDPDYEAALAEWQKE